MGMLFVLSPTTGPSAMKIATEQIGRSLPREPEWFHPEGIEVTRTTEPRRVWWFLPVGDERL